MRERYQELILNEFECKPKGTILTNSDFYYLCDPNTVSRALNRLCDSKHIHRLINGLYCIPEYSEIINEFIYPEPSEVAYKLADKFNWKIIPVGDIILNQMGLSSQVPSKYIYISDGPFRTYQYMNIEIKFKHTTNRYISDLPVNLAMIIQAIKTIGEKNITIKHINVINKYFNSNVELEDRDKIKNIPVWIYKLLVKM